MGGRGRESVETGGETLVETEPSFRSGPRKDPIKKFFEMDPDMNQDDDDGDDWIPPDPIG